jgi:hypothetical protein
LVFGGNNNVTGIQFSTEEYNGTSWSAGGTMAECKFRHGGAGTQTAGLAFGGFNSNNIFGMCNTEEYTSGNVGVTTKTITIT